jgi:EpsI family protein
MASENRLSPLYKNSTARILTIILVGQALLLYAVSRPEKIPYAPPLSGFPSIVGPWMLQEDLPIDQDTRDVLKADDLLSRNYVRAGDPLPVNLFIAAFKSQRNGKAPHSPRNCLPGAGWTQLQSGVITVDIPGGRAIRVNHYVVQKDEDRSLVLYWYESRDRVIASEYMAKLMEIADSIRYNRTDTAIVRVVVPIVQRNFQAANRTAVDFVQTMYPVVRNYLPK